MAGTATRPSGATVGQCIAFGAGKADAGTAAAFTASGTATVAFSVLLPADYVSEHVDLGYAVTTHRAQGITVNTVHAIIEPATNRENLYVAMTRGSNSNTTCVATDQPDPAHVNLRLGNDPDADIRSILADVLRCSGAELSVHETITAGQQAAQEEAAIVNPYLGSPEVDNESLTELPHPHDLALGL